MITIKESTREDVKNIQSLWADGDVMEFIWPGGLQETEEGVWEWLNRSISIKPLGNHYSIYEDGKYCGETSYKIDEANRCAALDIKLFRFPEGGELQPRHYHIPLKKLLKTAQKHFGWILIPQTVKRLLYMRDLDLCGKKCLSM